MTPSTIIFNTFTASGADCKVTTDGNVSVAGTTYGAASFHTSSILGYKFTPYVADTPQVTDVVATATASTAYSFSLSYTDTLSGVPKVATWTGYTSAASTTRTAITTAAMNFVNGIGNCSVTATLSGSGNNKDLVLTSETYYPKHYFDATGSTGVLTPTISTAGVVGNGSGAGLINDYPQLADLGLVSTNNYDTLSIYLANPAQSDYVNGQVNQVVTVYGKTDATNVKSLIGYDSTNLLGYGTLTAAVINNRLATYSSVGANVAVSSLIATRASGSFFTENIKSGDAFLIGTTPSLITFPYWDGVTFANLIVDKAIVSGSDVSAAAALLIKFTNLPS